MRRAGATRWTLAGVAIALALLPLGATAQKPRAERPTYAVGDTWVLSDGEYRVGRITRDAYVFTAAGDREIWLTRDLAITYVKRGSDTLEIQEPPRLSWPLEPGKRGIGRAIIRVANASIEVYTNWRVEAAERVTVAGGAFDALRIRYVFDPEIPGHFGSQSATQRYGPVAREAAFEVTWWYAPQAQRIVKSTSSKALLTFELGGAPPVVAQAPAAPPAPAEKPRPIEKPSAPAPALTISVSSPADQVRVDRDTVPLAGLVTSSRGVARVVVTLNGTEVAKVEERTARPAVSLNAFLTLREGSNLLVVAATDADGVIRQELRTIHYEKAPLVAVTRDAYAVVIGIGRYDHVTIPTLKYAVADADAMYKVLTETAGFKKDNVLLLTDRTERKPTLRNIKYALGTFLARAAQKDDTVIVYFAGHGAPEVDQRGLERDGLAKYLIPSDADPDDLFSSALPMDDLQTIFGRIEAERVVMFLDACYSGAAGGRTFASKKTRSAAVDDLFLERLTRSKGRAIVTASRPAEVSIELPELGHGIFTYYLAEGLRGAGDLNRDGIVSLQELYEYVEQQVVRKSRSVGGNQHPVMKGELEGVLPLTKVRGR